MLRRWLLSAVLVLGLAMPAFADTPNQAARSLVDGMAGEAISTLAAPDRTQAQIETKFHDILNRNFDLKGIGRFVLGRYWRVATPEQQTEYLKLFEDYIVGIYANRFSQYSGETVQVTGDRADGENVVVNTHINLTKSPQPVAVDWRLSPDETGKLRVSDVIIEQVSMSITQRSEFATIIQNNGGKVEALLALLRSKTGAK